MFIKSILSSFSTIYSKEPQFWQYVFNGVILSSWDFKRGEGVRIRGESDDSSSAYQLKDELSEMVGVDESGEEGAKIFEAVRLGALNKQKDGKQKFDLECLFTMPEGE